MSTQIKLIIPLLNKNIKKTHLTERAGFVNAYTWDKNRPFLDNHIFLLYDDSIRTEDSSKRFYEFSKMDSLYDMKYIYINNHMYVLYIFNIIDSDIKYFLKGLRHKKDSTFARILQFWGGDDISILKYLNKTLTAYCCTGESVPEEDFTVTLDEFRKSKKNPEGLVIDSQGSFV